jgi:acetyl/propionyl-CoA carboxylase alpha subunit
VTEIRKLLVANRGEIARRVFRTCHALGIGTVAVYAPADAALPFVHEADEAVPVDSYLSAERLVEAAVLVGADAVHPGYGFLAEDATFARRCVDAGLTWVGPPPDVLELAGSKLRARELARRVEIPVLDEEGGFPLLVKASAGGGGRGMRIVQSAEELDAAKESAAREAEAAFGDGTLYVERFVAGARHVEVQILGDTHGGLVHLYGRDCTVQRRWQKVIEEAPFTDERVLDAAVRLGRELGYVNAGTVEFLLAPDGDFFFLEVNGRLQVEHPVTEEVLGLDLVELQLRVAQGEPVPDLVPPPRGHAIEARIYAEGTGTLARFRVEEVRLETGVEDESVVGGEFDPMLAKAIVHAPTRAEAIRKLEHALARAQIHGVPTNRDQLLAVLRHPDFVADELDTQWFERLTHETSTPPLHAAAAALALQADRRAQACVQQTIPSGWRNVRSQPQRTSFEGFEVEYSLARDGVELAVNGEPLENALVHTCTSEVVELEVAGVRRKYDVHVVGDVVYVDSSLGSSALVEVPRFVEPGDEHVAGSLVAPMPGTVVRVAVETGAHVEAGQPLVAVEAMKMEHTISAPHAGVVSELRVGAGDQVDGGSVLVVLEADDG